jgi:hypothetical protein
MTKAILKLSIPGWLLLTLTAQAPPPKRPASAKLRSVTVATAPERAVYELFLGAVVAHDRRAADPQFSAEYRQDVGQRLRSVTGLDEASYGLLKSAAYVLFSALEDNGRQADAVLRDPAMTADARRAAIAALKTKRDDAIDGAIQQLKTRMRPELFQEVDLRIRQYIVPGLRIYDLSPAGNTEVH